MRFETSMDVLNKRSLLTLVYVCIYIYRPLASRSQRNSIFSRSIPTDPNRFFEIHVRPHAKYLQSGDKNGRGSRFIFVEGGKKGLSTVERSLDLELDLISYFWNFVSPRRCGIMRGRGESAKSEVSNVCKWRKK